MPISNNWKRMVSLGMVILFCGVLVTNLSLNSFALDTDGYSSVRLGWDGNMTAWIEQESDAATGSSYMLHENYGGWWADAEKSPTNTDDDLLCWAATCSNMLEWTGWGFVDGMDDTDDFMEYYVDHTTDFGSLNPYGLEWWFTGNLPTHSGDWSVEDVEGGDFWSSSYTWTNYVDNSAGNGSIMPDIRSYLMKGYPVGLGIYPLNPPGGHAITCWGFNYDNTKDRLTQQNEYYLGVWVSDSDSHKNQADPDDYLRYYEVEWNSTSGDWYMPNYGSGWKISAATSLHPFPGETRPVAADGGPYTANEGSVVTFSGSGSSDADDDPLKYRWDFDGDGDWDTSWSTSSSVTNTWYDNYNYDVYLEVFDERLRDMDFTTVTINNVAPTVTATGDTVDENGIATVSGTITDPGLLDTFTVEIDWGEGSPESFSYPAGSTTFSETHRYLDDDPTGTLSDIYSVGVTVTDDDGGVGTAGTTVTVNNVDPVITTDSLDQPNPQFILPLVHSLDFSISFSDTGTKDTHNAVWDWDDSTTSTGTVVETDGSGTVTGAHTFSSPGTYDVVVTVTDDDGGYDTHTITIVVVDADEAIEDLNDYIQGLDGSDFKNSPSVRKNSIDNKISAILTQLELDSILSVITTLNNDVRSKADGTVDGRSGDDWITDPDAQEHICMKIDDIVEYLEYFL